MYRVSGYTSSWAAVYFFAIIAVGTYIFLNLFVAIVVDGYATDPEALRSFKTAVLKARLVLSKLEATGANEKSLPQSNNPQQQPPVVEAGYSSADWHGGDEYSISQQQPAGPSCQWAGVPSEKPCTNSKQPAAYPPRSQLQVPSAAHTFTSLEQRGLRQQSSSATPTASRLSRQKKLAKGGANGVSHMQG